MQTFSTSFETRQPLPPRLGNQSTPDLIEGSSSGTVVSSPFSTEEIGTSYDIRPITPEISYPYPLYKGGDYYKRRLAMKPNQVGLKSGCNTMKITINIAVVLSFSRYLQNNNFLGRNSISPWGSNCFFGYGREREVMFSSNLEHPSQRIFLQ